MRTELIALTLALVCGSGAGGCPSLVLSSCQRNPVSEMRTQLPHEGKPVSVKVDPGAAALACSSTPGDPDSPANRSSLENYCKKILNTRRSIWYLNTRTYKMSLQLLGIYTREDLIFFCVRLRNHSHIDYGVDSIRFCTADDQPLKKIPRAGKTISPVYSFGNTRLIRGKTGELCVFALPRFTLPGKERLLIEVSETNGGRRLRLLTDNYTLVRARVI